MSTLRMAQAQKITFVLVDALGAVVTGLAGTFTLQISKNGGAFAGSTGVKAEIGSGWYSYVLSTAETDTAGPLAVKVTGTGAVQKNISYAVYGTAWAAPAGTNILTAEEGAAVLRCSESDSNLLMLLPGIDMYLKTATGRDWTLDTTIHEAAKNAARMLLVRWYEDPGGMVAGSSLGFGLQAAIVQLSALALQLAEDGIPYEPLRLISTNIGSEMAITTTIVLAFNHPMAAAATGKVSIEDGVGNTVTTTNTLDSSTRVMTLTPSASLSKSTSYRVVLEHANDIYGQTADFTLGFNTED